MAGGLPTSNARPFLRSDTCSVVRDVSGSSASSDKAPGEAVLFVAVRVSDGLCLACNDEMLLLRCGLP